MDIATFKEMWRMGDTTGMKKALKEQQRLVKTPIDFDALIADGKLERITATKYKVLGKLEDLPEHVLAQVRGVAGPILTFPRQPRKPACTEHKGRQKGKR